jgi:hypothetical protein
MELTLNVTLVFFTAEELRRACLIRAHPIPKSKWFMWRGLQPAGFGACKD